MQPWVIAIIVGVIVVAAAIAWFMYDQRRSTRLKQHFGPEYNRAVLGTGNRRRAEAELVRREALAKELRERPLHPSERERFMSEWKMCQVLH